MTRMSWPPVELLNDLILLMMQAPQARLYIQYEFNIYNLIDSKYAFLPIDRAHVCFPDVLMK